MSRGRSLRVLLWALLLVAALVGLARLVRKPPGSAPPAAGRLLLSEAMSPASGTGFARALSPRPFSFPEDHGPHPEFRTEWWYVTGNLRSAPPTGRRFGYQLTIFRSALEPPRPTEPDASEWRTDAIYMGHLALTDVSNRSFVAFERFSRGAAGLAGARARPFRVWIDDWFLETSRETASGPFPLRLVAADGKVGLDLSLVATKPAVLQGEAGLSRKGPSPGNASYYYSMTRLETTGGVSVGERRWGVEGSSWLDREWSTSALEPGTVGWDWFALQLSDGRDLVLYRLRHADGSADAFSSGVVVAADGSSRQLDAGQFAIEELDRWTSPETGVVYPSGWRLASDVAGIDLAVEPLLEQQEHTGTVIYWEGAVDVEGSSDGVPVEGVGYVELTGYRAAG